MPRETGTRSSKKLAELRESGVLIGEEFEAEKQKILNTENLGFRLHVLGEHWGRRHFLGITLGSHFISKGTLRERLSCVIGSNHVIEK